jgi:phosphoribosylamine--glycine ligase
MFSKSHRITGLFIAPGNAGTDELGENLPDINPADPQQVADVCAEKQIDYVFCGIEDALENGMVDVLQEKGIPTFGAPKKTARLESDKSFAKAFMQRHGIPTTASKAIKDIKELEQALADFSGKRMIIKRNGLSRWPQVLSSDNPERLLEYGTDLLKKDSISLEEYHVGIELSVFALTDGSGYLILPPCADYKKAREEDTGPATNGMGAICPVPLVNQALLDTIDREIISPTFKGLTEENLLYKGVLFFGIILTSDGPKLLEYHVRFGDPEAQTLFALIKSDLGNIVDALEHGTIDSFPIRYGDDSAVGIVVASYGYPGISDHEVLLKPIPAFPEKENIIFHGATRTGENGTIYSSSGRCFTVVGIGRNIVNANTRAYEAVKRIHFEGAWYRKDIGNSFFES